MRDQSLAELLIQIKESHEPPALFLEKKFLLTDVLEMRKLIKIKNITEPLIEIPKSLFAFKSEHAYQAANAPYGDASPFYLRKSVVERLCVAQTTLTQEKNGYRLQILDGYRPKAVQVFMRNLEHRRFATELGFDPDNLSEAQSEKAWAKVDCVWARPSNDPTLPTPHSTGAAVDLTIVDPNGNSLEMGSNFDESSDRILPNFYSEKADSNSKIINAHRELLNRIMEHAGFYRLTHEWWHFSYGDQVWALLHSLKHNNTTDALYGEYE